MGMLYYALVFLIVGLVAGALGLFGIAAIAGQISWVLFLVAPGLSRHSRGERTRMPMH
jgi:uncharacterized membrane protein YtjA (UPF0391 family)